MIVDYTRALVLSGGSVKGAFEAGAIKAILDRGYTPGYIIGISVGSLNSAFLANAVGQQNGRINWQRAANELWDFWANEITSPKKLVKQKGNLGLLLYFNWSLIFKQYKSILNTKPLKKLIRNTIKYECLSESPVVSVVGSVDIFNGNILYTSSREQDFIEFLIASTAIPIVMPVQKINDIPYLDGGIRDVTPLGQAINLGAEEIVTVCCQSETIKPVNFNYKDFVKLSSRIMDITVNETVNNDIKQVEMINKIIDIVPLDTFKKMGKEYTKVPLTVIRPETELNVEIEDFTQQDIVKMLQHGYEQANRQLGDKFWDH